MDHSEEVILLLLWTTHFILGPFAFGFCMEKNNLNDHYVHIKNMQMYVSN